MKENSSLFQLQQYIKQFDHNIENKEKYFMKLIEEVGELSEVLRKDVRMNQRGHIKGTIEEELSDVLYYVITLANVYDIDLEESFKLKDELNKVKWNR
ncbi:MazG nucleotide pyrophosphohydrolase domain-containing protein [Chengkuizengella axinellae]|uniref:MazG nucleotide pyrophosphohydrolase domain-containing protein n=1 Tax=Chengkuizengella axinellae TaxID=3064388 RepID=A0ABT9IWX0_9BACL|nr:MazG nucleotide pyrophosphohydrolase domain-containing protein [Chengkuizengella sp. 2205SS18-9]MDP5273866.1 MazG nucleotide pyrophosphohydrolase domain-containing protein [Chengkuizengella sp. 2205SS18-9]